LPEATDKIPDWRSTLTESICGSIAVGLDRFLIPARS